MTREIISIGLIAIAGGDSEGKLSKHRTPEPTLRIIEAFVSISQ
ncbi:MULTISPECIES: hypothetical protein [Microcystis]|uniref:Uncharacterized protein n=1 Tax=Microcystis aeruginosa PCC 7806SL TaxID=1903187 RepID=A0AB33BWS5_MICA7|nr:MULTISPECIES: hypothetical protein [Microcystis]ARI80108.1 hypothetical protein BH695_0827 [Microcystis aeruginosa PCC 7806SL]ELS50171.1 hypothetical protein C789_96 [Microcystis aeruginosa FACHB-905 = DIANCHI905]MDB9394065.1 hypothetical protein [Microcystis aeruginosa CS-573]ODV38360.1 hypothetical protein BFG60_2317 [Microcystis aeruginosa NIES-98]WKX63370.1 hypothetical protein Q3H53_003492 [Microcystis aeruginosa PCC 7806]